MNYHFRVARTMSFRKCVHIHINDPFTILYYRSLSICLYPSLSVYINSLLRRPYIGHSETHHMGVHVTGGPINWRVLVTGLAVAYVRPAQQRVEICRNG